MMMWRVSALFWDGPVWFPGGDYNFIQDALAKAEVAFSCGAIRVRIEPV